MNMRRTRFRDQHGLPCHTRRADFPSVSELLKHEQYSWDSVQHNTCLPVQPGGLIRPALQAGGPAVVPLPANTFLGGVTHHTPSARLTMVYEEISYLQALAFENGCAHWILLPNHLKPTAWTLRRTAQHRPFQGPNDVTFPEPNAIPQTAFAWIKECIIEAAAGTSGMNIPMLNTLPPHARGWVSRCIRLGQNRGQNFGNNTNNATSIARPTGPASHTGFIPLTNAISLSSISHPAVHTTAPSIDPNLDPRLFSSTSSPGNPSLDLVLTGLIDSTEVNSEAPNVHNSHNSDHALRKPKHGSAGESDRGSSEHRGPYSEIDSNMVSNEDSTDNDKDNSSIDSSYGKDTNKDIRGDDSAGNDEDSGQDDNLNDENGMNRDIHNNEVEDNPHNSDTGSARKHRSPGDGNYSDSNKDPNHHSNGIKAGAHVEQELRHSNPAFHPADTSYRESQVDVGDPSQIHDVGPEQSIYDGYSSDDSTKISGPGIYASPSPDPRRARLDEKDFHQPRNNDDGHRTGVKGSKRKREPTPDVEPNSKRFKLYRETMSSLLPQESATTALPVVHDSSSRSSTSTGSVFGDSTYDPMQTFLASEYGVAFCDLWPQCRGMPYCSNCRLSHLPDDI